MSAGGEHLDRRRVAGPATTADDVVEAATTLFAERGFHGTSLKQVAALLQLRIPSLYNHMESKNALLRNIVLATLGEVTAEFEQVLVGLQPPAERLHRATYVYALHHANHPREAMIVNQDARHLQEPERTVAQTMRRNHEHRFRELILAGNDLGAFSVESPKLASFAIREMCVSIARWFREDGPLTPGQVAQQYADQALLLVGHQSSSH